MGAIASQITSLTIVYSKVYSGADQRKHESSASLAFVRGIHRGPVNSLHKWPVTRKMFPFDDVIMIQTFASSTLWPWHVHPGQQKVMQQCHWQSIIEDRFNVKTLPYQYRDYHYKNKTVMNPSHLFKWNYFIGKTTYSDILKRPPCRTQWLVSVPIKRPW